MRIVIDYQSKIVSRYGIVTIINEKSCMHLIISPAAAFIEATLHRASAEPPNIPPGEHKLSETDPNGGSPWDGRRAPGVLNTFVVFFLFFHFARRFWNQTCFK
jgi:hypothetical protein